MNVNKLTKELGLTYIRRGVLTKDCSPTAKRCYILASTGEAQNATGMPDRNMPDYSDEQVAAADIIIRSLLYLDSLGVPDMEELLSARAEFLKKAKNITLKIPSM